MTIRGKKAISFGFALIMFLYMQPFVTWTSYPLHNIFLILMLGCLLLGLLYEICIVFKNPFVKRNVCYALIFAGTFAVYSYCTGKDSLFGRAGIFLQYLFIVLFVFVPKEDVTRIFQTYRKFIAMLLIPAVFFFLLRLAEIEWPYHLLSDYRVSSSRVYIHYPFSILAAHMNSINLPSLRLCGFMDEPGALGTFIALILALDDVNLKDIFNIILFVAGCMTLSTAFFLLLFFYLLCTRMSIQRLKRIPSKWLLFVLPLGIAVIVAGQKGVLAKIFNKLSLEDVRGTSAIWTQTRIEFGDNILKYLFGNGYYSGDFGRFQSWTMLIYDIGIIGILITVLFILLVFYNHTNDKKRFIFRILFLVSMIQRPYIFTIPYMLLFLIGVQIVGEKRKRVVSKNKFLISDEVQQ